MTQLQKFHTDEVNQRLHKNICGSHVVPHSNLFNSMFFLVNFSKVLCSSANELQQNFFQRRIYSTNYDCFVRDSLRLHLTFVAFCLLSVIHKQ